MNRAIFHTTAIITLIFLAGCGGILPDDGGQTSPVETETTGTSKQVPTESNPTPTATTVENAENEKTLTLLGTPTETTTPTETITPTATTTPIKTVTITTANSDIAGRDLNNVAGASVDFFAENSEINQLGVELKFDAEANPETANIVIEYTRQVPECGYSITQSDVSYCAPHLTDREDFRDSHTIKVRGIYSDEVVEAKTIQALAKIVGQEDPAKHQKIPDPELRYPNPWSKDPIVVNISYETSVERSYAEQVRSAVGYWETRDDKYGNYTANWTVEPNASEADLTITVQDAIFSCGYTIPLNTTFIGCADTLNSRTYVRNTDITIVDGLVPSETTELLKHEFGHIYGRQHGQEPMPLMRAIEEEPAERLPPHDTGNVTYYIDHGSYDSSEEDIGTQVEHALKYFESHNQHAPDNLTFIKSNSKDDAEVVIERNTSVFSDSGGSTLVHYDYLYELDGGEYRNLNMSIQTHLSDSETLGWHVGYWLGTVFSGADSEEQFPPPFKDADTYEDRVEWWD